MGNNTSEIVIEISKARTIIQADYQRSYIGHHLENFTAMLF